MSQDYRGGRRYPYLLETCRELRRMATPAERKLWELLRARQLEGLKFRRQHQLGGFILDFYCSSCRLGIELDGAGHETWQGRERDEERTYLLEELGIQVLRFRNEEVLRRPRAVLERICTAAFSDQWQEERPMTILLEPDLCAPSPFRSS